MTQSVVTAAVPVRVTESNARALLSPIPLQCNLSLQIQAVVTGTVTARNVTDSESDSDARACRGAAAADWPPPSSFGGIMRLVDGFLAFKANRRLHYQFQNAAVVALVLAGVLAALWPSCEIASRIISLFALGVLVAKFFLQPAVISYIPRRHSSEYIRELRRQNVKFPSLYIAYTGKDCFYYDCLILPQH